MPTGVQLVAAARTFLDFPYTTRRPINCSRTDRGIDCSALPYCAARMLGVTNIATNSSGQAIQCRDAGRDRIPIDRAMRTPGALLFWGLNHGYWGYGALGHVAVCVGDGVHIIEARGRRYGCVIGTLANRPGPSNAGLMVGIDYTPGGVFVPAPPPPGGIVVPAQFSPPLQIVSFCRFTHPTLGTAVAMLGTDGGVFCDPASAYQGGPNGKPYFAGRTPARIEAPRPDEAAAGKVYVVVATSGERYHYP